MFAGFARSLSDPESDDGNPRRAEQVAPAPFQRAGLFGNLSGRRRAGTARLLVDSSSPRRIVATDPVRIGENLLALGALPVGAGTFDDVAATTPKPDWPWPDLVEGPVRDRIQNVGYYGTDKDLIERVEPDLILDLRYRSTGETLAGDLSDGRCGYGELSRIAPTALVDVPLEAPGLVERLEQLAKVVSLEDRVAPLVATWRARIAVLREHVVGETVSACLAWGRSLEEGAPGQEVGHIPDEEHECQLFTSLGMELTPPPEGRKAYLGGSVMVGVHGLSALTAPTLFLTLDGVPSDQVRGFLAREPLSRLPAVRQRRVFDLGWRDMRGGWFSYHWRLDVIARAFGICRLSSRGPNGSTHLAVAASGKVTAASTSGDGVATLSGPKLSGVSFETSNGSAASIDIDDAARFHLRMFPEAYSISTEGRAAAPITRDRESALERITRSYAASDVSSSSENGNVMKLTTEGAAI